MNLLVDHCAGADCLGYADFLSWTPGVKTIVLGVSSILLLPQFPGKEKRRRNVYISLQLKWRTHDKVPAPFSEMLLSIVQGSQTLQRTFLMTNP